MKAEAGRVSHSEGPPKRRLRNFLIDRRFQLKYTGMVVGVTFVVAIVLGFFTWQYSTDQTDSLSIQMMNAPDLDESVVASINSMAEEQDRIVGARILGGILILVISLGFTGIVVTHRLVGPAHKMKRLFGEVARGSLNIRERLRRGDELQDVFYAFEQMVDSLRERRNDEVRRLDAAIAHLRDRGAQKDAIEEIEAVRESLRSGIDMPTRPPPPG